MTQQPQHHPQDDLLISHATCNEHPAVTLLVSAHAALCSECRRSVKDLEAVGAALFEHDCELPVSAGARERALAAIRAPQGSTEGAGAALAPACAAGEPACPPVAVDAATNAAATVEYVLALRDDPAKGTWRWRAPGVSEVRLPLAWNGIPVSVIRLRSGLHIPQHTHNGRELTLILAGSLRDAHATYRAGDVADYDQSISHDQFVDSAEDCLCLVVNQSRLVPQTVLGHALAWIAGA
ncbi:MAG: ChrR family anti-sigma-E factor [Candidatus Binatia bacterium]